MIYQGYVKGDCLGCDTFKVILFIVLHESTMRKVLYSGIILRWRIVERGCAY